MTDLQHAKDFLAGLHRAAEKRSANGSNATSASSPATMMTPETPQTPSEGQFPANSSATRGMDADLPARAVVALWGRFTHVFGNRFESMYGPALDESGKLTPVAMTWARSLRGCSPEQLAAGLVACMKSGREWPPTLPEFWKLCHPAPKPLIHRELPALPRKPSEEARAAGRRELAILRERLGLKAPDEVPAHA